MLYLCTFRDNGPRTDNVYWWWEPNYGDRVFLSYQRHDAFDSGGPCGSQGGQGCKDCEYATGPNGEPGPYMGHPIPHMDGM